jgi:membrane spanning protein
MRRVVLGDRDLEKIALLNDISRKMVMGGCTLDYAFKKMKEIKARKRYSATSVIAALTLSGPFFAIMFGGTFKDSLFAFLIMAIQAAFLTLTAKYKLTSFVSNFLGAFIATVLVMLLNKIFLIHNPFSIIIMSLMPLVPGVQVTNAVRDFMAGDYLSGMIGIQAAIFVSTAIALGVVMGLKLV